jgi:hypothetical protein
VVKLDMNGKPFLFGEEDYEGNLLLGIAIISVESSECMTGKWATFLQHYCKVEHSDHFNGVVIFTLCFARDVTFLYLFFLSPMQNRSCLQYCITGTHTYSKGWRIFILMNVSCSSLVLPTQ